MQFMNVRMPDGTLLKNVPVGTTKAQIDAKYSTFVSKQKEATPPEEQAPVKDDSNVVAELAKGAGRGLLSTGALLVEGLPAVGRNVLEQVTGSDYGAKQNTQELADALNKIQNDPNLKASVESYKDVDGIGSALEYGAGALGQIIPDIATGLGGGVLAKAGAKSLVKGLTKEGAEKAFKAGVVGSAVATEAPSTQVSTFNETGDLPGIFNLGVTTAVKASLEKLGDLSLLNAARKTADKSIIKEAAKATLKQAGIEGTTEGFQQIADELSAEFTNPAKAKFDTNQVVESVLMGAIGGGVLGGGIGAINAVLKPTVTLDQAPTESILSTEELPSEEAPSPPPITPETPKESANDIFKKATSGTLSVPSPKTTSVAPQEPVKTNIEAPKVPSPVSTPKPVIKKTSKSVPSPFVDEVPLNDVSEAGMLQKELGLPFKPDTKFMGEATGYKLIHNAKNAQQATYVKLADDLLNLFGVNIPVNFVVTNSEFDKDPMAYSSVFQNYDENDNPRQDLYTETKNTLAGYASEVAKADFYKVGTQAMGGLFSDKNGNSQGIVILNDKIGTNASRPINALAHEIGHIVHDSLIDTNPEFKRQALQAYQKAAGPIAKSGLAPEGFNQKVGSLSFDKEGNPIGRGIMILKGTKLQNRGTENQTGNFMIDDSRYAMSYSEWMAEQIARWVQTNDKPVTLIDKYFKWVADVYRKFFTQAKNQGYYPNDSIAQILERLVVEAKAKTIANKYVTKGPEFALSELRAYHASPYAFDKFTTDKVNTGEGTQYEGWGLYFASLKDVSIWYYEMFKKGDRAKARLRLKTDKFKDELVIEGRQVSKALEDLKVWNSLTKQEQYFLQSYYTNKYYNQVVGEEINYSESYNQGEALAKELGLTDEVIEGIQPKLYEVEINLKDNQFLQWDTPYKFQPENIKKRLAPFFVKYPESFWEDMNGSQVYDAIIENQFKEGVETNLFGQRISGTKEASLYLNELGIKGIKYKDGDSRSTRQGKISHNFVVFDEAAIEIRQVFDNPDFQLSDMRRPPKTEVVKDTLDYKYVFKPEAIQHEEGYRSITGDGDGTIRTFDKQGKVTGELVYSKTKNNVNIDNITLKQNGARQKQDTSYALVDALNKAGIAPTVTTNPSFKPYQEAYQSIQQKKTEANKPKPVAPKLKTPSVRDVKTVPLFLKTVLPKLPPKVQNFFKSLPKELSLQVSMVDAVISRSDVVDREMRFALTSPETFGLTKADIKVLSANKAHIIKFVSDNFRQGVDLPFLSSQRLEDILPSAYDAYIESRQRDTVKFDTTLNRDVSTVFDKLHTKTGEIKDTLTQSGITKLSDVYYIPTTFEEQDIGLLARQNFDEMERTDRMSKLEQQQSYDDLVKIKVEKGTVGPFSSLMKYISPAVQVAKNSPLVGHIFNIAMQRREHMLSLQNKLMGQLKPSILKYEKTPQVFNAMVSVLESNRLNNFKGFIDKDGFYNYVDKAGKRRRVTDVQKSKEIMNIRNIFDSIRKERLETTLAHRDTQELFRSVGLPYSPTIGQIDSLLNKHGQKLSESQNRNLQSMKQFLELDQQLKQRDYVPFTRHGSHGVTIKTKGEGNSKPVVAFVVYDKDSKGRPVMDERWYAAQKLINDYAGKPNIEISNEFELTKDALLGQITNKEMTIDIIEQLVEIMTKKSTTSPVDSDTPNTQPAWKALGQILTEDVLKKGFNASMKEARNIAGYRDNWFHIIPTYLQGASFALSNQRFAPLIRYALRASQSGESTPVEREYAKKYAESLLNVESELMNNLRNLQFNFALSGNISSALIQLTSFTTMMPATLTIMTNSPIRAYRYLAVATKDSGAFMGADWKKDTIYDFSPERVRAIGKKKGWTDDKINFILRLAQQGYLTQTLSIEEIGADTHDESTWQGKLAKKRDQITRIGGMGLRVTEEFSRISQALAMYDALDNPNNLNRFHKIVLKENEAYRKHLEMNPTLVGADREYLLKNGMNLALALFGKEGRAPFQNSAAQFVFPFATYPWQAFLNFYRMAKYMGPEGRKGAMVASLGIISGAGVIGLPGFFLLKEMLELVLSQVFEEDIDLDKEALELMNEYSDTNPWTYHGLGALYRGAYSDLTNTDINERLQFQTPFDTQVKAILDWVKDGKPPSNFADSTMGVLGGSIALAPFDAMKKYQDSGGSFVETMNVMMPVSMRNLISTLAIEPEKGKSIVGVQTLTRDEARTPGAIIRGVAGFKGANEGRAEELARAKMQIDNQYTVFKTSYAKKLQRFYKESQRNPDNLDALARFEKARADYIDYLSNRGFGANQISTSIKGLLTNAQQDFLSESDKQLNSLYAVKKSGKEVQDELYQLMRSVIQQKE